jgi:hypothetical protein
VTALVESLDGGDGEAARDAWLRLHAPNVANGFEASGGLRYPVSLADQRRGEPPFLGAAELWFRDRAAASAHLSAVPPDPFMDLTTGESLHGVEVTDAATNTETPPDQRRRSIRHPHPTG